MRPSLFQKIILSGLLGACTFFCTCRKEPDCSACELTEEERAHIFYDIGDEIIFKNDQTNVFDTLTVVTKNLTESGCSGGCYDVPSTIAAGFTSTHLARPSVIFWHSGQNFGIRYYSPDYFLHYYSWGSMDTVTIDTTTYTDILPFRLDSNKISGWANSSIPWKVDYSKSKGFLRFHLKGGITWTKQ